MVPPSLTILDPLLMARAEVVVNTPCCNCTVLPDAKVVVGVPPVTFNVTPVEPAELLMLSVLNVVGKVPPKVCTAVPVKLTVPVPGVNAEVPALLLQFPVSAILLLPAESVPEVNVTLP